MEKDIVCGMYFVSAEGCKVVQLNNKKYYFCCDICKEEFEKNTGKYLNGYPEIKSSDRITSKAEYDRDPVCGEMINIYQARGFSLYKESRYYFCCSICKKSFDQNPEFYADKSEADSDNFNSTSVLNGYFRIL